MTQTPKTASRAMSAGIDALTPTPRSPKPTSPHRNTKHPTSSSTSSLHQSTPSPSDTPSDSPPTHSTQPSTADPPHAPVFCVEDDTTLTTAQHMSAGALAGMTEHMAMYPVDTIKTRMQSYVAVRDYANLGMFNTTRSIVAAEGIRALWRGVGAVALSAGPAHALYFATYEGVRNRLAPESATDGLVHPVATATAGVCATVAGDGIMTPMDVIKQRMQLAASGTYTSVMECAKRVYVNHGFRAFYAGYGATLVMNVPFTAVYFSGYETAKKMILDWRRKDEHEFSAASHCAAGAVAGAMAAAFTNPLDVVKTRLQTQGEVGARRYRGLTDALRSIRVEEGLSGLMKGVRPRVLFHMPAAAVCWTTYEFCKHVMSNAAGDGQEGEFSSRPM